MSTASALHGKTWHTTSRHTSDITSPTPLMAQGAASLDAPKAPGTSEKRMYSLSGRYVGNTTEGLPEGIYLVRQTDGNTTTARKVALTIKA